MSNLAEAILFGVGFTLMLAVVLGRASHKPTPRTGAAEDAATARVLRRAGDILEPRQVEAGHGSPVVSLDAYRRPCPVS